MDSFVYAGYAFIIIGVLFLFQPFIVFITKLNNAIKGVKTEITPLTITIARVGAILAILFGVFIIFEEKQSKITPANIRTTPIDKIPHY